MKQVHERQPLPPRPYSARKNTLLDIWSVPHLVTGVFLGWLMQPGVALTLMILWEPLEILILSPMLAKRGIDFGFESVANSVSDVFVDAAGVILGYQVLTTLVAPPFHLF